MPRAAGALVEGQGTFEAEENEVGQHGVEDRLALEQTRKPSRGHNEGIDQSSSSQSL